MPLATGQRVLDRYEVETLLGSGGMGQVWRGRHVRLGSPVALKVLSDRSPELVARFEREARLMALVRHPNVVTVMDYGLLDDGSPCIAMELVEGEPLDRRLLRRGTLPWPEAIAVGEGMLAGLDAVHRAQIVHRDLKPSNVIIAPGSPEIVKLIDFGIARSTRAEATRFTRDGATVGTPDYMSPEQLFGYELDPRTDVYTTSLILYELLTGSLPFGGGGGGGMDAVMARLRGPISPPVGIPPGLGDAILEALAQEPDSRPATAALFAARLREVTEAGRPQATLSPSGTLRVLLATRLPPSRLAMADERKWLSGQLPAGARGFVFGGQFWFAVLTAGTDAAAIIRALTDRYGSSATAAFTPVDEGFALTASAMSGASPFPEPLAGLLEKLARG